MSARLLALLCLATLDASLQGAGSNSSNAPEVVVFLTGAAAQPSATLAEMRRELDALMLSAGYRLQFLRGNGAERNVDSSKLVVVNLNGYCGISAEPMDKRPEGGSSLAFSYLQGGEILPFSRVNCGNLTQMIGPALEHQFQAQRDHLYGRAMARILAHELYHVLLNTEMHGRHGVSQSSFTVRNLLADEFGFAEAAIAKLTHPQR